VCIYWQQTEIKNFKNTIYNSIQKLWIPRDLSSKIHIRHLHWDYTHCQEKFKKELNGEIHWFEDSIFLSYQFIPNWFLESRQLVTKSQWYFYRYW
jgi:hypothetical protein